MQPTSTQSTLAAPQRVIPLLQSLNRLEGNVAAITLRLDSVTNHVPSQDSVDPPTSTITGRLNTLGDTLQYLLDNIEL